jgi:hypothetical protein
VTRSVMPELSMGMVTPVRQPRTLLFGTDPGVRMYYSTWL